MLALERRDLALDEIVELGQLASDLGGNLELHAVRLLAHPLHTRRAGMASSGAAGAEKDRGRHPSRRCRPRSGSKLLRNYGRRRRDATSVRPAAKQSAAEGSGIGFSPGRSEWK